MIYTAEKGWFSFEKQTSVYSDSKLLKRYKKKIQKLDRRKYDVLAYLKMIRIKYRLTINVKKSACGDESLCIVRVGINVVRNNYCIYGWMRYSQYTYCIILYVRIPLDLLLKTN